MVMSVDQTQHMVMSVDQTQHMVMSVDQTQYMVMSVDQNAGCHSIRTHNSPLERVEQFKYLGTIVTDQTTIRKKVRAD